jgi:hypothetical protein
MPTIKLTDQFGLDVDARPAPASALLKYLKQLPELRLESLNLSQLGGLTLEDPAVKSVTAGVLFAQPVDLGEGGPSLSIGAGTHASLRIINDVDELPGEDPPDASSDTCYVALEIEASVSPAISTKVGGVTFGATPSTAVKLASYSPFRLHQGVTLLAAIKEAVGAFAMPVRCSDLVDLAAGQITRVSVEGTLQLSGSVDLLATTNPLASVSLPAPLPVVSARAGGSVTAGVSFEVETEYELVARKLENGAVRVGWYHRNETEVSVHVKASEGISGGLGGTDLFSQLIGVISANPKADLAELESAGVSAGQATDIQAAVKAAVGRKLEIAIGAELSASDSKAAAFLYEVTPATLTDDSRQALDRALRGDLTGLHAVALPGITCVRSVWDNVLKRELALDVNLLGVLNYRSVTTLALEGKVLFEPATGALTITDQATAQRIQSLQVNFGADTQKLRHVLAESFLITAAYHGANQVASAPSLRCSHSFFEMKNSTDRAELARELRAGAAIGLLSPGEVDPPAAIQDFGRTLFNLSADYDSDLVSAMFLDGGGSPRPSEDYESAGRAAILDLVPEDGDDAVRRRPAMDDKLWNRMKDVGQPSFPSLFVGVAAPLVGAITADYSAIAWWADAMHKTAVELASVRQWAAQHPTATLEDTGFQTQRESLAKYLRGVAANTREEFGQPWGLVAMYRLVGRNAGAKLMVSGPRLVISKKSEPAAAIGR